MFGWQTSARTPAQKQLGDVLFNENVHVLSSFELNRIASLSYGDDVCDEIFEMLEELQRSPLDHSVLTLQKSLVVTRHILIYGSEKCVNSAIALQRGVEALLEYNTVLMAQKKQGAAAFFHSLKGGGVDKGFPVREAAQKVYPLMVDTAKLRELRNSKADPNSLVPVGSDAVAFVSDDVRHFMLQKRIEEQYKLHTKSNLASESGGFGAGYASRDGKSVVGAAHGLEEMIKQAEIANRKFKDEGKTGDYALPNLSDFSDYAPPSSRQAANSKANKNNDLLGVNPQQGTAGSGDLLDFSSEMSQPRAEAAIKEVDLLGDMGGGGTADFFGTTATSDTVSIHLHAAPTSSGSGLLDFGATLAKASTDPFVPARSVGNDAVGGIANSLLGLNVSENVSSLQNIAEPPAKVAAAANMGNLIMSSNSDRFAALDSMEVPNTVNSSYKLSAKESENRLLGQSTFGSIAGPASNGVAPIASSSGLTTDMGFAKPGTSVNAIDPSSFSSVGSGLKVAQRLVPSYDMNLFADKDDGGDFGMAMGGAMGAGLEPSAPAPGAPPPPPPPC